MPKIAQAVTDQLLETWLKTLKPQTAKNYGVCIQRLLKEMGTDCKALYEEAKTDPVGTWKKIKKTSQQIQSPKVRVNACYAARRFLLDQDEDMMLPESHLKQPDLVKPPAYLTWDDAQAICAAASPPYNLVFKIMLSAGWGAGEFLQFNKAETWNAIKAKLATNGQAEYFRFGFNGRKKNRRPFYSLIPMKILNDALALEAQGKIKLPLSYRAKNGKDASALDDSNIETNRRYLESAFNTALKRAPIVLAQGSPSLHEFRDTFLTRAVQVGCSDSAANFVMGHVLDKLGYNKCFNDEAWISNELSKIHGPAVVTEDALAARDRRITELEEQVKEFIEWRDQMLRDARGQWERAPRKQREKFLRQVRKQT
jgi:integrase